MINLKEKSVTNEFKSFNFKQISFPKKEEEWPNSVMHFDEKIVGQDDISYSEVKRHCKEKIWKWPSERIIFLCDIHADEISFYTSLLMSKVIKITNHKINEFILTEVGKRTHLILGGDFFDKGPLNLTLLDAIKNIKSLGVKMTILAGNHDIRTYTGLFYAESKTPKTSHLFTRMGKKTIPLFKEIWDKYLKNDASLTFIDEVDAINRLSPSDSWYKEFPKFGLEYMPIEKVEKEIKRIKEKVQDIKDKLLDIGMTYGQLYATLEKAKELFLTPGGEYYWLFDEMKIVWREGSFLFIHAGLDDKSAKMIKDEDYQSVNEKFKELLASDPFDLYHGFMGNIFRTKYRPLDFEFSQKGANMVKDAGINAIIHGHKNIVRGHRIVIKKGVLNFECDVSMDRITRQKENLEGRGGGTLIIEPQGYISAHSTDYPKVKVFRPENYGGLKVSYHL